MSGNLSESQVIRIWQHQGLDSTRLVSEEGTPIEIIYPGRINDDRGPDFRDAVLADNEGVKKGDIEVHVKTSHWRAHRHNHDAVYNRVIMHVVMWHNTRTATRLQNGREIPTLALHKYLRTPARQPSRTSLLSAAINLPCCQAGQNLPAGTVTSFLDRAGKERFLAKAAGLQTGLPQTGPGQTLYQAIMGALGYQKNKLLFLELARRLPLHILESITRSKIPDEAKLVRLQTLLSETAGLLPPWHLFKVRPRNSPHLRLEAMSYLLLRYQEKGLLEEMVGLVKKVPLKGGHHQLETGFLITVDGRPLASDKPSKNVTLLGSGRAADIVVNVLLPFTVAWGRFTGQSELERKAVDLYRNYPRLSPNSVERHMASQLGLSSNLVNSAGRQQGLIQIYKRLCTQGKCGCCRLSQP